MDITKKIEAFIGYNTNDNSHYTFDYEYQEIFAGEGERKAQYIIADLLSKFRNHSLRLDQFAYLCVGGADGSEPAAILKNTNIRHAIMIEISDAAAESARNRSSRLRGFDKHLYVLQGDATQRLDDALSKLEELKDKGDIQGVIVSAQAVLHELPRRSPNFDMIIFLGRCFSIFEKNAIYSREPISPERWPDFVELSIPRVLGARLKTFSELVNDKLKISNNTIDLVGSNYVYMENVLALEVLHKLLRCRSVSEFKYELNEQLTCIDTNYIQNLIEKDLGPGSTRVEPFITEGFREEWIANCVSVRDPKDGKALSIPNTHARIIGMSLALSTDVSKSISTIWTTHPVSDHPIEEISRLNEEFIICRKDRVGKTRRKAIRSLLGRIDKCKLSDFYSMELKARLWRELTIEARNQKDYFNSIEETQKALEHLTLYCSTKKQKKLSNELLIEWVIDFSQTAGISIELNTIVHRLNNAKKYIGKQIDLLRNSNKKSNEICHLLCLRAKCSRALAILYLRRGQSEGETKKQINKIRGSALIDAEKANKIHESYPSQLELSLCLFANSATTYKDTAKRGLKLLENSWFNGSDILAGYELVKQYKLRHRFKDAVKVFLQIEGRENDRRRFLSNVTSYSASVIGLHYHMEDNKLVKKYAFMAREWLNELISYDRHQAKDIVDFCHMTAICGFPFEDAIKPIERLKPTSDKTWNQIVEIAKDASFSGKTLDDALLLGLENAIIWSKIGSIYLEFADDFGKAIEFYERASIIDPLSPIFYLNKAEALAYHKKDFKAAKISFDCAISLKHRKWLWYKSKDVQKKVERLKFAIKSNLDRNEEVAQ